MTKKVSSNCYYHLRCVWSGMPKLPKITSLLFYCNILRKDWVMKLIFCMQMSMKACCKSRVWFWWGWLSIPKVPEIASLQCLYNIWKNMWKMKFIFLHVDKHQSFLNIHFNILGIKVSDKVDIIIVNRAWSSIFKLLKVVSLQYLCNISKKKLGMEVIFDMHISIKVSTSWYYLFWCKWPDMFKMPEIENWY